MCPVGAAETIGHTMSYTLTQAAEAAKVQRSTVFKWIKAGKVSATKADDGTFRIDPAELHRFLVSVSKDTPPGETAKQADTQPATAADTLLELVSLRSHHPNAIAWWAGLDRCYWAGAIDAGG